ncbi:MAG: carboxylating nicotinate-nucleotide diphosphorylase [Candidatus Omnitrophica bacterium]|nr:carboxylating nicotinate-nucleotide diphosphorylase [Candidatus Omnitrophota bacterium]
MKLSKEKVLPIIMSALSEDVASGDITSNAVFEKDKAVIAQIVCGQDCVLAGVDVARWVFSSLDEKIMFRPLGNDGDKVKKKKKVISLRGSIKNILAGERTALNFLGRLSGIATLTSEFVKKAKGARAKIYDTRKTTPGMRVLEKYAVRLGGGYNHRMGLWDSVLIKDNHLAGSRLSAIQDAVRLTKAKGYRNIEVEVDNLKEFQVALASGADIIMLDNMKIEDVRKAVRLNRSKAELEVSGRVTLDSVSKIAKAKVDRISIGSLTHSAPSIDFSLEIC